MSNNGKILIIDDDRDVLHTAKVVLKPHFGKVLTEDNPEKLSFIVTNDKVDVILLDMNYTAGMTSGKEGLYWLKRILSINPDQQVVMMTAYGDLKLAVEAMKVGAADFIVKPWENEKLIATIQAAYNHGQTKSEMADIKQKQTEVNKILSGSQQLIGESPAMKELMEVVNKVAATDANIMILGENGTGKEVVAKLAHQLSGRTGPFVKVDVGALSESLFESELFGHKKGAFTDAREDRVGRFVLADQGTLFLDEIGNMSLAQQAKLLTALQSREVVPVGGNEPVKVNCRVITATNENLPVLIEAKEFREDLLYRLNTVEINIPALAERKDDIALLAEYFIDKYGRKYRKELMLESEAIAKLKGHSWPGNVRELEHTIERAVIMSDSNRIGKEDILLKGGGTKSSRPDSYNLDELEKYTIEKAIKEHHGNMSKAAKALGLGRTTLYRKLDKYGIDY